MKIILAVDGSRNSEWAADMLMGLPLIEKPEVSVLHVLDLETLTHPLLSPPLALQYSRAMREEVQRSLAAANRLTRRITDRLRSQWKEVHPIVEKGRAANKIIQKARKEKADLIVLGSHGLSNVRSFLLGSVSQKVTTYAPCSVLVVKRKFKPLKKILVAVDGSKYSKKAIEFLKMNFRPENVQASVLNVWDYPLVLPGRTRSVLVEKEMKSLRQAGFKTSPLTLTGHPAATIVKIAKKKKMDLVVLGSRGLTGLREFFLGSVSHKIVKYSQGSILVVRGR
jgi:nucleotide-binding universal stress UspA family protein